MEICRATLEDAPGLVSSQRETQDLHVAMDPTFYREATDDELLNAMRAFLAAEQTIVWIASMEGVPAGFLVFKISTAAEDAFCHARHEGLIDQFLSPRDSGGAVLAAR